MSLNTNKYKLLTFLTPALVSFGSGVLLLVLQVIVSIPLIGLLYNLPEFGNSLYNPIWNLIILFLGQILGTLLVLFVLIPWLRVYNIERYSLNRFASGSTLLIICMTWAIIIVKSFVLIILFDYFQLASPRSGLESLLLPEQIITPITIIILLAPLTIGAPIFEELVYRRVLIPLLEKRGLSPFGAVLASSIFFTLLHAPSDLIYGNLTGAILHLSSVLILAFVLGFTYIQTRNVLYPILIHGVANGISVIPSILTEGTDIAMAYDIFYLIIIVAIGLIYLLFLLLKILKNFNPIIHKIMLGKISINSIDFFGYLLISISLLILHTMSSIYLLDFSTLFISPILLIIIWLIIKSELSATHPSLDKNSEMI